MYGHRSSHQRPDERLLPPVAQGPWAIVLRIAIVYIMLGVRKCPAVAIGSTGVDRQHNTWADVINDGEAGGNHVIVTVGLGVR